MTTPNPQVKVGVYTRRSLVAPVLVSQEQQQLAQLDILIRFAKEQGWTDENIVYFSETDEPDGLIKAIEDGEIKTVIVHREDRLFRDPDRTKVEEFVRLCQEHNVTVVTPSSTYDFSDSQQVNRFLFTCQTANEYISKLIRRKFARKSHNPSE